MHILDVFSDGDGQLWIQARKRRTTKAKVKQRTAKAKAKAKISAKAACLFGWVFHVALWNYVQLKQLQNIRKDGTYYTSICVPFVGLASHENSLRASDFTTDLRGSASLAVFCKRDFDIETVSILDLDLISQATFCFAIIDLAHLTFTFCLRGANHIRKPHKFSKKWSFFAKISSPP